MEQIKNRIDHVAWMCRPENHEQYVEKLSKLFRIEFEGEGGGPEFGVRFTWSWSGGLEVLSPWGEGPRAEMGWKFLKERGEGLFTVVMGVENVEEVMTHARSLGYTPGPILQLHKNLTAADEEAERKGTREAMASGREWLRRGRDCTENVLDPDFLGGKLAIGSIVTDEPQRSSS